MAASSAGAAPPKVTAAHGSGFSDSELASQWYTITNQTVTAAAFAEPVTQSRTWAVSWLAAARAVDAGHDPVFQESAFVQALHDTLAAQIPSQQAALDVDLTTTLATFPDGQAKSDGIAKGHSEAAEVLAQRAGDGLDTASVDILYTPPPAAPGIWQPTPPTFGPAIRAGEGNAKPFLLAANNQFDPGPPPALTSSVYLKDLAEVDAYGSATSTVRTAQQTDVAKFWEPSVNIQYVQVLGSVLADVHAPPWWDARFVAAFHVVTTDAQIAIYNAKYEYVAWRPVTAIQTGSVNPDPTWTSLFAAPRHPEYPSGHSGYAGAAQAVLTAFLGPIAPAAIAVTSPTDVGSTHTYTNWRQITNEIVNARDWEGIHFRFSDNTGVNVGSSVGFYDLTHLRSIGL